jgi:amidase
MALVPSLRAPTVSEIFDIAASYGVSLTEDDALSFQGLMKGALASYVRMEEFDEPKLPVKYPRTPGYRPPPEENPYNAWYWKTDVKGRKRGPLAGKRIALKDNICLAGVPMMHGSKVLEGFVPDIDATIVTRVLDAGGTVVGKAACEDLCFSGSSHTSALGMIKNPHKPTHSSGGSSSGSAVVVAIGEADMAFGGDQAGSIRTPSCWSGVYGMKPTHGLVPYTGIFNVELTLDHTGPMCATVEDVARLLKVVAGSDGYDPRQVDVKTQDYMSALGKGVKDMNIARLREGFGRPESEAAVDGRVEAAIEEFRSLGATVSDVSIPMHLDGVHIWNVIGVEGSTMLMVRGNAAGTNWQGYYDTALLDAYANGWRSRANELPETVKFVIFLAEHMQRRYHGRYYAKAQNLRRRLREAYDRVLGDYDLIAMPTLPMQARKLPGPDCSREENLTRALEMIGNTSPFNCTGHPAINVPCGMANGLPIGMMLVAKRFDEASIIRAAEAFEGLGDWKTM